MKLSVVILNYNVRYFLELCLKSVQAAICNLDAEIIVVDNNSSDDSCAMITDLFPAVHLIRNEQNIGFSKANNQGVKEAKGEFICILNPDTVVSEDTFEKLIHFAEKKERFGVIGCKLIDGRGNFLPESKRNIPVVLVALQKMLGRVKNYYAGHLEENEVGEADVMVGAFMFMKRKVCQEIGGFDEDYFMYGEDIDLSYRLIKAGYKNYYYGKTTIIHYKGESTLKDRKYAQRFYYAMQLFYKKHFSRNKLFDLLVWFGLQVAFLIRKTPKSKKTGSKHYVLVSNQDYPQLRSKLGKKVDIFETVTGFNPDSEVIFDANTLAYKQIITELDQLNGFAKLSFKILPKDANFILGSDDSINRGEVIQF